MRNSQELKKAARNVWGASPAGWVYGQGYAKGTKDFFEAVIKKRFSYEVDWLDEIVNFDRFKNKKVLEIGCGAGYDAFMFCKAGVHYTGIDITPENPPLALKHLSHYGFQPTIVEMDAEKMTFSEEFDYVYSFGVLHHTPDMQEAFKRVYKSLKKNGEFQVILYHKHSIFYIFSVMITEWILKGKFRKWSLAYQRSLIEYSEAQSHPLVNVYSKKELLNLLKKAGFVQHTVNIRKLLHEDLPNIPFVRIFYRFIPTFFLKKIGTILGWYISVRCYKKN